MTESFYCKYCGYKGIEKGNLDCPVCGATALITRIENRDKLLHLCSEMNQGGAYDDIGDRIKICRGALGIGIGKVLNHEYFHKILHELSGWMLSAETLGEMVINDIPELSIAWDNFMEYLRDNGKNKMINTMFELTQRDLDKEFRDWSLEDGKMKNIFREENFLDKIGEPWEEK